MKIEYAGKSFLQNTPHYFFEFLASEANIPNTDSIEKIMKPVLITEMSAGKFEGFIDSCPI